MRTVNNEKGAVVVFVTLMIVLLIAMVGMGLDTGQLTYTRSQGQAAVDAAALSAVSGLPLGAAQVAGRVAAFDSNNDYLSSPSNSIKASNITYIHYDSATGAITNLPDITNADGVRVALEKTNPYTSVAAGTAMKSPVFLTPLMKLLGQSAPATADVSVSAVAVLKAIPGTPIAIMQKVCNGSQTIHDVLLTRAPSTTDNSCWTTFLDNPVSAPKIKEYLKATQSCSGLPKGLDQYVTIGTDIYLNNGVVNSTYDDAHTAFIDNNPGQCWLVPVVPDSTQCNKSDPIVGWATICPTEVTKTGSDKYVKADVTCNQDPYRAKDNLCFSSRLVRDTKSGM
jgi:Flp pilus assembly protein TadG